MTFVTRDEFRDEFPEGLFDEGSTPLSWPPSSACFSGSGCCLTTPNLEQLLVDLNQAAPSAAYYRPDTGTMYIIDTGQPFAPSRSRPPRRLAHMRPGSSG